MAAIRQLGPEDAAFDIPYPDTLDGPPPVGFDQMPAFPSNELLATLVTVVRRPPELPFLDISLDPGGEIEALVGTSLDDLDGLQPTEFALAVVELLVRREPEFRGLVDADGRPLIEVMEELARMYEHLFMSQTGMAGG